MFELARGRRAIPPASAVKRGGIETGVKEDPMRRKRLGRAPAFTLAEIMLVVGLIGLPGALNGGVGGGSGRRRIRGFHDGWPVHPAGDHQH